MERNIILAGVGGQGILSIAYVVDNASLEAGLSFKQAEVHGMAQRGGAVQSHLRFADHPVHSDLIPRGKADMILSVEPLEVLRYWHFLSPTGWVVSSVTPYVNIPTYPELDALLADLAGFERLVLVDSGKLAKAAGNSRAQNMVMVGAASPLLGLDTELLLKYVRELFARKGDKVVEVNCRAFALGRAVGLLFRALVDAGMAPLEALRLTQRLEPASADPTQGTAWASLHREDRSAYDRLLAGDGPVTCDRVNASRT